MAIFEAVSPLGRFAPLAADHPGVGEVCPGCNQELQPGDVPTLVNGVPADDAEQERADAGLAHNVACMIAHERCAYGEAE